MSSFSSWIQCDVSKRCKNTPSLTHPEFSRAPDLTCCRTVKALGEIPVSPVVTVTERTQLLLEMQLDWSYENHRVLILQRQAEPLRGAD